eukprot:1040070-Pelagomonas_calceolata.AAC.2
MHDSNAWWLTSVHDSHVGSPGSAQWYVARSGFQHNRVHPTMGYSSAAPPTAVQRPGVAQSISLDVYILRWAAAVLRQVRKLNTDLPALVDEWASSLFRCVCVRACVSGGCGYEFVLVNVCWVRFPSLCKGVEFAGSSSYSHSIPKYLVKDWLATVCPQSASVA